MVGVLPEHSGQPDALALLDWRLSSPIHGSSGELGQNPPPDRTTAVNPITRTPVHLRSMI
jgi:hypothetical protein